LRFFADRPISNLEDLHGEGHKRAVKQLYEAVDRRVFSAVLGPRRVGKTSVIKTMLSHYNVDHILFDLSPYMGLRSVSFRSLVPASIGFDTKRLSGEAQIHLALITFRVKQVNITSQVFQANLLTLLEEINRRFERFALVFDEAHVLPFIRGVNYKGLLQFIHNNFDNITVILTGSMPGLLEEVISPKDPTKPSFARYWEEINVPRWTLEETASYLERGLREARVPYTPSELEEVHYELGGIPGFISFYGLHRARGASHPQALERAVEYAVSQHIHDLRAFLQIYNSPLYITVLKIIAETPAGATWSELMAWIGKARGRRPSKSTLHRVLTNLRRAGLIQKRLDKYVISDSTVRKAILAINEKELL